MTQEVLAVLEQALNAKAPPPEASPPFRGRFALTGKFLEIAAPLSPERVAVTPKYDNMGA